jgi:Zn-dependent metalloprotease
MLSLILPLLFIAQNPAQELADNWLSSHGLAGAAVFDLDQGWSKTAQRTIFARYVDNIPIRDEDIKVLQFKDGSTYVEAVPSDYSGLRAFPEIFSETAVALALEARFDIQDNPVLQGKGPLLSGGVRAAERVRLVWHDRVLVYEVHMKVIGDGKWHEDVLVDAQSGEIVEVDDLRIACCWTANGTGDVFDPNPVQTLDDHSLNDSNDSNNSVPSSEYFTKTLLDLDGSGYLQGPYCSTSPTSGRANQSSLVFQYQRKSDYFEEVMSYYHIDMFQRYLQSIGHMNASNRTQLVDVNGTSQDNSWFETGSRIITYGTGGVDDGEDADIIVHEYGHALHYDVQGSIGNGENGAMSEGYGDYFAASIYDDALVGEWDAVSYTSGPYHYLRRVDENLYYPNNLNGQVHHDGQIWSAGLWDFRSAVGREVADNIIVEAMSLMGRNTKMPAAGNFLLTAEQQLYGGKWKRYLEWALDRRGIVTLPSSAVVLSPQDSTPTNGTVRLDLDAPGHGGAPYQTLVSRRPGEYVLGNPYNATINVGLDLKQISLSLPGFGGVLPSNGKVTMTGQIPAGWVGMPFVFQSAVIGSGNSIVVVSTPCAVRQGIH